MNYTSPGLEILSDKKLVPKSAKMSAELISRISKVKSNKKRQIGRKISANGDYSGKSHHTCSKSRGGKRSTHGPMLP